MKLYADENVPRRVVLRLRAEGHAVGYVVEGARGLRDEDVLREAREQEALLLTEDRDFKRLVRAQPEGLRGLILLRVGSLPPSQQDERIAQVIRELGERLIGQLTTIYPDRVTTEPLAR